MITLTIVSIKLEELNLITPDLFALFSFVLFYSCCFTLINFLILIKILIFVPFFIVFVSFVLFCFFLSGFILINSDFIWFYLSYFILFVFWFYLIWFYLFYSLLDDSIIIDISWIRFNSAFLILCNSILYDKG